MKKNLLHHAGGADRLFHGLAGQIPLLHKISGRDNAPRPSLTSIITKIMRWSMLVTGIICCTAITLFAGNVSGQSPLETKITVSIQNEPLKNALDKLSEVSGVKFMYSDEVADSSVKVSVDAEDHPLREVMERIFTPIPYSYRLMEDEILVRYEPGKLMQQRNSNSQPVSIHVLDQNVNGTVSDTTGMPLPGVTVQIKETGRGTITDENGYFEIPDMEESHTLVFRMMGFQSQEIIVGNRSTINVVLVVQVSELDETLVIGYGTTSRRLSTGSVARVTADEIKNQPITNPLQALAGKVPGMIVTQSSGLPEADVRVQIRGQNSIAGSNTPLFIIDGVPFGNLGDPVSLIRNPLNSINPADIESVEVLKDADATAIYGSRGANGVILITTKSGKPGESNFDLTVNKGIGQVTNLARVLDTPKYLEMRTRTFEINNVAPTVGNAPDLLLWDQNESNDWQKIYLGGNAVFDDVSGSYTGGNDHLNFLIGGSYHRETTIFPTDDEYLRRGFNFKTNYKTTNDRLRISAGVYYTTDNNEVSGSSIQVQNIAILPPNFPIRDSLDNFHWFGTGLNNPEAGLQQRAKSNTSNLTTNLLVDYSILPGLNFKTSVGYNSIQISRIRKTPAISWNPLFGLLGSSTFGNEEINTFIVEPQFTFFKPTKSGSFDFLLGATYQSNTGERTNISASNYTDDSKLEVLSAAGNINIPTSTNFAYKYASVFGRIVFNEQDKYIVNVNFRRDGSSRFGPNNRFGNFGAIGTAWLFSNENFLRNSKILSFGKIRSSYGTTGNDGIGDYGYLSTYQTAMQYGNQNTVVPSRLANPDFRWEVNRKYEVAVDLGFFNDKLLASGAYFHNVSSNQLVGFPLPTATGFSSFQANLPAKVQNTGLEFTLNTQNITKPDFSWSTGFNLTIARNNLISYPNLEMSAYSSSLVEGESLDIVKLYQYTGIDPETGLVTVLDVNDDGVFTPASSYNNNGGDFLIAGQTYPDFYGGLGNTINYKNWSIELFFQFVKQDGYNLLNQVTRYGMLWNVWDHFLDLPISPTPVSGQVSNTNLFFSQSDQVFTDASFIRLRNLTVRYSIPSKFTNKIRVQNTSLFMQGQNLFTITNFQGYDPETALSQTIAVPPLRMITGGIQLMF